MLTELDHAAVRALARILMEQEVEAVVVALLHSYANPAHEDQVRNILLASNAGWQVITSSSVVRDYYEFERTSTAAVQAYLQPLVFRYAADLQERLATHGLATQTFVMQSNGSLVPPSPPSSNSSGTTR